MKNIIKKHRFTLIALIILGALGSISLLPQLTINTDFTEYLPHEIGNRKKLKELDKIFGGNEKVVVILHNKKGILNQQSINHVRNLCNQLLQIDGVVKCSSILDAFEVTQEYGITTFNPIVDTIPQSSSDLSLLKEQIANNKMGQRFMADDFSSTAIILSKSSDIADKEIISAIETTINLTQTDDTVYIGGLPYIRQSIKSYIKRDLKLLLPGGLLLMILMLYLSFKEWKGVFIPFAIVILSIVYSFGLMAILNWQVSIVSILLPIMLIAIANDYSIHLINLYQEKVKKQQYSSPFALALALYEELKKPIILTALTTIGGMLGLLSHEMPPAVQLGLLAAFGIGLALLLSLLLVPVVLTFFPIPTGGDTTQTNKTSFLDRVLSGTAIVVNNHPKRILGLFLLLTIISIGGLFLVKVDTNVESYFLGDSKINKGIELVNKKFGGSQYVSILFEGDILSPEVLHRMEKYTEAIKQVPNVGHIITPSLMLKELSKGIYQPNEEGYDQIPNSEAEAEQLLTLLSFSGYDEQLSQIIDFNQEHSRILVSMTDGSNQSMKTILSGLTEITANDPNLMLIAGPGLSKIQLADMVINGQIKSLVMALVIILVLLSIIFRSVKLGLKGSLPLVLSCLFLFGLMGYSNIPLDIVTALLSSIMIGVGVDYTIHFMWRYNEEYQITNNIDQAIKNSLETTGRGIVFNAFSVIVGFSILVFSNFAPLRFFGILVMVSIFSCLISALLLVPALYKINPRKRLKTQNNI